MTYDNDGYGIANMDAVTAHEMGHIFYALDQYLEAQVPPTERSGYLNVENQNTEYGGSSNVASIMRSGVDPYTIGAVDLYARGQIGWRDTDVDGVMDILDFEPFSSLDPFFPNPTFDDTPTYAGTSYTTMTYPNNNPYGFGNNITINKVSSGQFRVDGGSWEDVQPVDGSFDEPIEAFTFTTNALGVGSHLFEVRAQNTEGIWEEQPYASDTLTITTPCGISVSCDPVSVGTLFRLGLDSPHDYPNDFDYTWYVRVPGVSSLRVHFSSIDVEDGFDFVAIYNGSNYLVESYSGSHTDLWSPSVAGDVIRIRLLSNSDITSYGFNVDAFDAGTPSTTSFNLSSGSLVYLDTPRAEGDCFFISRSEDPPEYFFDHWELDGEPKSSGSFFLAQDQHDLKAVYGHELATCTSVDSLPDLVTLFENTTVSMRLTDSDDTPLPDQTLGFLTQVFYLNDSSATLPITYFVTNGSGLASVDFEVLPGVAAINFEAFFNGAPGYLPSSDLKTVFTVAKIYDVFIEASPSIAVIPVGGFTELTAVLTREDGVPLGGRMLRFYAPPGENLFFITESQEEVRILETVTEMTGEATVTLKAESLPAVFVDGIPIAVIYFGEPIYYGDVVAGVVKARMIRVGVRVEGSTTGLIINEVLYDPIVESSRPQHEWFELLNPTDQPIDLYGYVIEDNAHRMLIVGDVELGPREYLVVCNNVTAFREDYPWYAGRLIEEVNTAWTETDDPRDEGNMVPVSYSSFGYEDIYLNNDGDWLKLYYQDPGSGDLSGSNYLVDAVAWENPPGNQYFNPPNPSEAGTWNGEDPVDGFSIQRSPNCQDTNNCNVDFYVYPAGALVGQNTPGSSSRVQPSLTGTSVEVQPDLAPLFDDVQVVVSLTDGLAGPVAGKTIGLLVQIFYLNQTDDVLPITYYTTSGSGLVETSFTVLPGVAAINVEAFFNGDAYYLPSSDLKTVFTVAKIYDAVFDVTLSRTAVLVGGSQVVNVTLSREDGAPMPGRTLRFVAPAEEEVCFLDDLGDPVKTLDSVTDVDGKVSITLVALEEPVVFLNGVPFAVTYFGEPIYYGDVVAGVVKARMIRSGVLVNS